MKAENIILGKWYGPSTEEGWYLKITRVKVKKCGDIEQIYGIDSIRAGEYLPYENEDYWSNSDWMKNLIPTPIEVLKQYLPKNHPDLVNGTEYEIY